MAFPTPSQQFVRDLTQFQRDMIVSHVDGALDCTVANHHLTGVRNSLIRLGLLRGLGSRQAALKRPRATELTEQGRMVLGTILAWYADSLARAGLGETPMQVLARLKSQGGLSTLAGHRDRPGIVRSAGDSDNHHEIAAAAADLVKPATRRRIR